MIVKVISAQLTHDTETFSNMDPYCLLELGNEKKRTTTKDEAGRRPVWNQDLVFSSQANTLFVKVLDEDIVSDDIIGTTSVEILRFKNSPSFVQESFSLLYQGRAAGTILLAFRNSNVSIPQNQWGQQPQPYLQPNINPQQPWGQPPQPQPWGQSPQPQGGWGQTPPPPPQGWINPGQASLYPEVPYNNPNLNPQASGIFNNVLNGMNFNQPPPYGMTPPPYGMTPPPYGMTPPLDPNLNFNIVNGMTGLLQKQLNKPY